MEKNFSIVKKTKGRLPRLPFALLKRNILGKEYNLSLAFVDKDIARTLNRIYRKKDYPANILSFPYSKKEGEILICLEAVKKDAPKFGRSFPKFLGFLVIHGLLHLKGMKHGARMDRLENKYDQKYFSRNRPRNLKH